MPPVTKIALRALENLGAPGIILKAVPGGIRAVAREAGVSKGRVSQVLRQDTLPPEYAQILAALIDCTEWEIYQQLGQRPPTSPLGPLFDSSRQTDRGGRGGQPVMTDG
jgi:hypothetical protein